MKQPFNEKHNQVNGLIFEYEAMSQKGSVPFFEETAFWAIANYYAHRSDFDRSLAAINDALLHHHQAFDFYALKATILIGQKLMDEAAEVLITAQNICDDQQKSTALYRAEAYCRKNLPDLAKLVLEPLISESVSKPSSFQLLRQAKAFQQLNKYAEMFNILKNLLLRDPCNENALDQMWVSVELSGKYAESRDLHLQLLELNAYSGKAWHNLGFAYLNLEMETEALEAFEYAFISNPWFESAYREYAGLAFRKGMYRQALQCYQEMAENIEADSDLLVRMGECYEKLGDVKIAKAMYQKSLGLDPYNADAYFRFGACLAIEKDYSKAEKLLREAIRNEDRREEFHVALAEVYNCLGKHTAALNHYNKAVELAPDEGQYWAQLARFLMASGAAEKALEVLEEGMTYSFEADLLYCRSACLFLIGCRTEALDQLAEALSEDFGGHIALFNWAPSLQEDHDILELINTFQQ